LYAFIQYPVGVALEVAEERRDRCQQPARISSAKRLI
jgi:hypothetical protein